MKGLGEFVLDLMTQSGQMRATGCTPEDINRGLHVSLLEYAHAHGLVCQEQDIPSWMLKRCPVCDDTGWMRTTRLWRGDVIEAYTRCACRPIDVTRPTDQAATADKVASRWKRR